MKKIAFKVIDHSVEDDSYWLTCYLNVPFCHCSSCEDTKEETLRVLSLIKEDLINLGYEDIFLQEKELNHKTYLEEILKLEITEYYKIEE